MSKPKVGFYWCAACGGCEEAIVDLNEGVLDVIQIVDIAFWPCAMDFKKEDVVAMKDGELAVCFINGAIRSSEQLEMAELLRRKSQMVIAFGSCSHQGGIPGLANLYPKQATLDAAYSNVFSTVNPEHTYPQTVSKVPEGEATLPELFAVTKTLDQCIDVDYYLPGCPPPGKLVLAALTAIFENKLPEKGTVLAPDQTQCDECPRKATKPDKIELERFYRPSEIIVDSEKCLLSQGLLCMGPTTRLGCDSACINGNMPCTGCLGPISRIRDFGAKALSATATALSANEDEQIEKLIRMVVDPAGTFYRYSLAASFLHALPQNNGKAEVSK